MCAGFGKGCSLGKVLGTSKVYEITFLRPKFRLVPYISALPNNFIDAWIEQKKHICAGFGKGCSLHKVSTKLHFRT